MFRHRGPAYILSALCYRGLGVHPVCGPTSFEEQAGSSPGPRPPSPFAALPALFLKRLLIDDEGHPAGIPVVAPLEHVDDGLHAAAGHAHVGIG